MRTPTRAHANACCSHLNRVWHARCYPTTTRTSDPQPPVSTAKARKHPSKEYMLNHPGAGTCKIKAIPEETTLFGCYPSVDAFALAMGTDGQGSNHTSDECRVAAERIFAKHMQHLGKGLTFYLDTYSDFDSFRHRTCQPLGG